MPTVCSLQFDIFVCANRIGRKHNHEYSILHILWNSLSLWFIVHTPNILYFPHMWYDYSQLMFSIPIAFLADNAIMGRNKVSSCVEHNIFWTECTLCELRLIIVMFVNFTGQVMGNIFMCIEGLNTTVSQRYHLFICPWNSLKHWMKKCAKAHSCWVCSSSFRYFHHLLELRSLVGQQRNRTMLASGFVVYLRSSLLKASAWDDW